MVTKADLQKFAQIIGTEFHEYDTHSVIVFGDEEEYSIDYMERDGVPTIKVGASSYMGYGTGAEAPADAWQLTQGIDDGNLLTTLSVGYDGSGYIYHTGPAGYQYPEGIELEGVENPEELLLPENQLPDGWE